jgi:predicted Zn-dependent protease
LGKNKDIYSFRGGKMRTAIILLALALLPTSVVFADDLARFENAVNEYKKGNIDYAIVEIKELVNNNPRDYVYNNWLGYLCFKKEKYVDCVRYISYAANYGKEWGYYLAVSLYKTGDVDNAKKYINSIVNNSLEGIPEGSQEEKRKELLEILQNIDKYNENIIKARAKIESGEYELAFEALTVAKTNCGNCNSNTLVSLMKEAEEGITESNQKRLKGIISIIVAIVFVGIVFLLGRHKK